MALIFVDGFDHYATADIPKKGWSLTGDYTNKQTIAAAAGRRSTPGLRFSSLAGTLRASLTRSIPSAQAYVCGFSMSSDIIPSVSGTPPTFMEFRDGSTCQMGLAFGSGGVIRVIRGNTIIATSAGVMNASTPGYIEFYVKIDPTAGEYEVKYNGVSILSAVGVNTRGGTTNNINILCLGIVTAGSTSLSPVIGTLDFDDLYICDTTGTANNTFLGDCRVDTLIPAADGMYGQFTPSAAGTHYPLVDDPSVNTTDYVSSSTPGHRDSYGLTDLGSTSSQTVHGVQVVAAVHKDDAGTRTAALMIRSAGADLDGPASGVSTGQSFICSVFPQTPAAVAWTASTVNGMEAGIVVAT